ncbi:hypothetical protein [Jannaschia ovalis]|uniref:HEAT repeat-containing protein n=1 Tax=Jannaschia ovalis TaxID=3038773 RepID=A0ABY8LBM7_9RHOB|nr:hypothetical protein [Jannaschia sp. GRR-S6-38]WGH78730.1 hypothetical protein P8627_00260 [Jannaschia sp. GRR-S6-38]
MTWAAPAFIVVSGGLWAATFAAADDVAQAAVVHAGIVVLAGLTRLLAGRQDGIDWYLLPICLLGPLGVPAALTTYLTRSLSTLEDSEREDWYDELRGRSAFRSDTLASDAVAGRVRPQSCKRMRSAVEIFRHGSFRDRQRVLLWIARRKDPSLQELLKQAMRCDDTIIRSQAASLIVRIQASAPTRGNHGLRV